MNATAGNFAWRPHLLSEMDAQEMSWHISDHFPLWVEFGRKPKSA